MQEICDDEKKQGRLGQVVVSDFPSEIDFSGGGF
jgi:hypothetical protein